jgi:DNA-directed RNA polymerase specialized sigma subunit
MYKQLHEALQLLAEDERYLIVQLYFLEKTEREIAAL